MLVVTLESLENLYNTKNDIMIVNNNQTRNILFLGSCRIVAFLNYFLNDEFFGTNYNYLCILVHAEGLREYRAQCIHNDRFKQLMSDSTILVAEFIKNYDHFNTSESCELNIFKFQNNFEHKIILPNYCDPAIYARDIIMFGGDDIKTLFKRYAKGDVPFQVLSQGLLQVRNDHITRYINVIRKSCMPKLEDFVRENIRTTRIALTINHPTNALLIEMQRLLLETFFQRTLPQSVLDVNNMGNFLDQSSNFTTLTCYDVICFGYNFGEFVYDKNASDRYILSETRGRFAPPPPPVTFAGKLLRNR
jgi:hypothetical protein